ncbi:hypothetical protein JXM67_06730 [candidate division WOR-3 bacterium]|nr:hypothetical protein [candidate division WOR-3 bacterium]
MIKRFNERYRFLKRNLIVGTLLVNACRKYLVHTLFSRNGKHQLVTNFCKNIYARVYGRSCRGRYPIL